MDGTTRDYGAVAVMDDATTFFELADEQGTAEAAVYSLATSNGNEHRRRLFLLLTRWTHAGRTWGFQLRPLLPHESVCADGLGYSQ